LDGGDVISRCFRPMHQTLKLTFGNKRRCLLGEFAHRR
jgi:hypothetical protein